MNILVDIGHPAHMHFFKNFLWDMQKKGHDPVFEYKTGVKCRWLIPGDLLWFAASLLGRRDKLRVIREFSRFGGMKYDILSKDDLLPAVGAMRVMAHQMTDVVSRRGNVSGEVR
jgi:hypothetical protein